MGTQEARDSPDTALRLLALPRRADAESLGPGPALCFTALIVDSRSTRLTVLICPLRPTPNDRASAWISRYNFSTTAMSRRATARSICDCNSRRRAVTAGDGGSCSNTDRHLMGSWLLTVHGDMVCFLALCLNRQHTLTQSRSTLPAQRTRKCDGFTNRPRMYGISDPCS